MSIKIYAPGNLGGDAEFLQYDNEREPEKPHLLMRVRVYFDNPVPQSDGSFKDINGSWRTVELWHPSAQRWSKLFRKGMRVLVEGREVTESFTDNEDVARVSTKIVAKHIAILPNRIEEVLLTPPGPGVADDTSAQTQRSAAERKRVRQASGSAST